MPSYLPVRLGIAAMALSSAVYALLLAGWARIPVLQALGVLAVAWTLWGCWRNAVRPCAQWWWIIVAAYLAIYAYHASAPEICSDAMGYQLGIPKEYLRIGSFVHRAGFYDVLPQGIGMLFTAAMAWGSPVAAKLVHFALLAASAPLIASIGRRLDLPEWTPPAAALLYFTSPIAGISGTCAYTDAGQVFFLLLAVWFALDGRPALAGLAAGFCYAAKIQGLIVVPPMLAIYLWKRRWRDAAWFVGGASLSILPWMLRAVSLAQNPVAPLLSTVFKNRWFWITQEVYLSQWMRSYGSDGGLLDLCIGGVKLQGLIGPAFLLSPIAIVNRRGRWALLAGVVCFTPWLLNHGARFAMMALPFFALGIALTLPKPLTWAVVTLEAVLCFPAVIGHWAAPGGWYLGMSHWPLQELTEYRVSRQLGDCVRPGARIYYFGDVAPLYSDREVMSSWDTVETRRINEALYYALNPTLFKYTIAWPERRVSGLRFELMRDLPGEWLVFEVKLPGVAGGVTLDADPNPWEMPRLFDGRLVTRWSTRERARAGAWFSVSFDRGIRVKEAVLFGPFSNYNMEVRGLTTSGWKRLAGPAAVLEEPRLNYRQEAVRELKAAGFTHILCQPDALGKAILANPYEWNLEFAAQVEADYLFNVM